MMIWGGYDGTSPLNSRGHYFEGTDIDADRDGWPLCTGDCDDANPMIHPGAAEDCNALDDDCDGITDNSPIPEGSPSLTVTTAEGDTFLSWTELVGATGYDVVRGNLADLLDAGEEFSAAVLECPADNHGTASLMEAATPMTGEALFYLVRGVTCGGPGTYDSGAPSQVGSRDAEINASPSACP